MSKTGQCGDIFVSTENGFEWRKPEDVAAERRLAIIEIATAVSNKGAEAIVDELIKQKIIVLMPEMSYSAPFDKFD